MEGRIRVLEDGERDGLNKILYGEVRDMKPEKKESYLKEIATLYLLGRKY